MRSWRPLDLVDARLGARDGALDPSLFAVQLAIEPSRGAAHRVLVGMGALVLRALGARQRVDDRRGLLR